MKTTVLKKIESTPEPLTAPEARTLTKCEETIRRHYKSFVEVGNALVTIREQRLYRVSHRTFETYVRDTFEMQSRRAYQLADAAVVVKRIANVNTCSHLPETEGHVRALVSLPPEDQAGVWNEAVESAKDGKVTCQHVAEVVAAHKKKAASTAMEPTVHRYRQFGYLNRKTHHNRQFKKFERLWMICGKDVKDAIIDHIYPYVLSDASSANKHAKSGAEPEIASAPIK